MMSKTPNETVPPGHDDRAPVVAPPTVGLPKTQVAGPDGSLVTLAPSTVTAAYPPRAVEAGDDSLATGILDEEAPSTLDPRAPGAPAANQTRRASETVQGQGSDRERPRAVGDYVILNELGRGGMGVVYQAIHRQLKRIVALKMVLAGIHAGAEKLARFRLEAEAIARLQHPNIIQIFDVGEADGSPYFALEFVDGGSLERYRGHPQSCRAAAEMIGVLARAIHAAHQAGVVHRDLKPANVLLAVRSGDSAVSAEGVKDLPMSAFEPKITDFGLAKQIDTAEGLSHSGSVLGTPQYMSPEQADGRIRDIGPATDVYALCVILYEMLTGGPPFRGENVWETLFQVRMQEPVPPSRLQPKVPRDLEVICLKGLRKDHRQRYATALELADDLRRFLDSQPILARPVPRWERVWKWARREPMRAAALVTALLSVLSVSAGVFFYGLYKAQQATTRQEKIDRQEGQRKKLDRLRADADAAEARNQRADTIRFLDQALAVLQSDPDSAADEVRTQLQERRDRLQRLLAAEEERQKQEAAQKQQWAKLVADRKDFADRVAGFDRLRDDVLFHAVSHRPEDVPADTAIVRDAAPAALEQLRLAIGQSPEKFAAELGERYRSVVEQPKQLTTVAADCYQLLLAWAEVEMRPPTDPADREASARYALRLLGAANALAEAYQLKTPRAYHLRRAQGYELLGQAERAKSERELAAGVKDVTPLDLIESARQHLRDRQLALAEADCDRVPLDDPNRFWAQYIIALCKAQQPKPPWDVVLSRLEGCLDKQPRSPWLLMHRAIARSETQQYEGAKADFVAALNGVSQPASKALILTNRSWMWIHLKEWKNAESDLKTAIGMQPNSYVCHVNLAEVYQRQGKRQDAIEEMDRAVTLAPKDARLYAVRGRMKRDAGDPKGARADLDLCCENQRPGSPLWIEVMLDRARLKLNNNELAAALSDCKAVLDEDKKVAAAYRLRAEALVRQNQPNLTSDALDALNSYLAAGGEPTPEVHLSRGMLHTNLGQHSQALIAFDAAVRLRDDVQTRNLRGWSYLAVMAAQPALDDFDDALKKDRTHVRALCGRATALVLLRRKNTEGKVTYNDAEVATLAAKQRILDEAAVQKRAPAPEALLEIVSIYALTAGEAASRRETEMLAPHFERQAVKVLKDALAVLPDDQARRAFWMRRLEKDGGILMPFVPLARNAEFAELFRSYGSRR
jgi:tetratricopeptide (TPR) repeat protein